MFDFPHWSRWLDDLPPLLVRQSRPRRTAGKPDLQELGHIPETRSYALGLSPLGI